MDVRPIDGNALLAVPNVNWVYQYDETGEYIKYKAIPVETIEKAPTLDLAPVVHGEWLPIEEPQWNCIGLITIGYRCSECGREEPHNHEPYCHCGAKMDGGKSNG